MSYSTNIMLEYNSSIVEELVYDRVELGAKHERLYAGLNDC